MRQIGTLQDEATAQHLADYLMTVGITTRLEHTPSGWDVWVHREEKVDQARAELEAFLRDPHAERYRDVAARARAIRKQAAQQEREHLKNTRDVRDVWDYRTLRRCPLTYTLIGLCVGVALLSNFGRSDTWRQRLFIARVEAIPADQAPPDIVESNRIVDNVWLSSDLREDLRRGEVWRLITPILLHFDPIHLFFDMYWLFLLGTAIEAKRGTGKLAALILTSAVLSNLAQYYYTGLPIFGGMSGVDLALFGYVWMKGMYEPSLGLGLNSGTVMIMLIFVAACVLGVIPRIANAAHLAGLAVGILAGIAPYLVGRRAPG